MPSGPAAGPGAVMGQPARLPPAEPLWPISDAQQPRFVDSVAEFLDVVLFRPHIDSVVVLRDGVRLLKQHDALPAALREACAASSTVRELLDRMSDEGKDRFKARLWHYGTKGAEKEVREKGDKTRTVREATALLRRHEQGGECPPDAPLYVSELRWTAKVDHPLVAGERVKTATNCDIYDYTLQTRFMPLWERSEGGIFVGERGTGSGLHVDQCLWSNVGRQWCGYKLFAVWPWAERHAILDEAGKGTIFHLPLSEKEEAFLRRAKTIALVGPGDVWVFSGGQPHMALGVGDGLAITAYESFVPANPQAVATLVRTNTADSHWKKCWMDDDDLDELYEDVVDALQDCLIDPDTPPDMRARLDACVAAMRKHGDAYVRRLWAIEDRRAKAITERQARYAHRNQPAVRSRGHSQAWSSDEDDSPAPRQKKKPRTLTDPPDSVRSP